MSAILRFTWTDEAIASLRGMWADGLPPRVIASKLGGNCTRNAVIGKAHRIGLAEHARRPHGGRQGNKEGRSREEQAKDNEQRARLRAAIRNGVPHLRVVSRSDTTAPAALNIPLLAATRDQCRFICTDTTDALICGHPTAYGTSWCDWHCRVCFTNSGYAALLSKAPVRRPMNGYVARPFVMPIGGGEVREVPFG